VALEVRIGTRTPAETWECYISPLGTERAVACSKEDSSIAKPHWDQLCKRGEVFLV
jgi:hypothetical protein